MLKKLAKWLSQAMPNHRVTITVEPKAKKQAAVAAEPNETAEMKRWRLLADHNKELADKKMDGLTPSQRYYRKHKEEIKTYMREYTRNKRREKAAAEGRELRASTKRNIGVSAAKDRKEYNKRYYNQTKFTGNGKDTFKK
jgi:hypothetical protein